MFGEIPRKVLDAKPVVKNHRQTCKNRIITIIKSGKCVTRDIKSGPIRSQDKVGSDRSNTSIKNLIQLLVDQGC